MPMEEREQNIPQKKLYEQRNVDDVFSRNVIAGLIDLLNQSVYYVQTWKDEQTETLFVPFLYNLGEASSERFI